MRRRRSILLAGLAVGLAGCVGGDDDAMDQRGDIEIVVDSDPVDLTRDRYQAEHADDYAIEFHLHEGSDRWYNEGDGPVTVAEGLDKLPEFGFEVTDDGPLLTIDEETYDAREDPVTIETFVNGEAVDPVTYELEDGDDILVEVTTEVS